MKEAGSFLWVPGWSADCRVWGKLPGTLFPEGVHRMIDFQGCEDTESIETQVERALEGLPAPIRIIGWSMGAMAALKLAGRPVSSIHSLYLIGACGQFVKSEEYPYGWNPRVLLRMESRLQTDVEGVLEDFDRRMFSTEERHQKEPERWKRTCREGRPPSVDSLRAGLAYLRDYRLDREKERTEAAVYLLSGTADTICPPASAIQLQKVLPRAEITLWEEAGHLPFWTQEDRFREWLERRVYSND
ncbi:alpha/beta fold hydrolase [Salinithrix halophila]|uniref:Alpha/beta fold hydrolase n=1 Tax=Salinithrix halophila TaxID=1485204 RepID=A0ABV8JF91_9BACL